MTTTAKRLRTWARKQHAWDAPRADAAFIADVLAAADALDDAERFRAETRRLGEQWRERAAAYARPVHVDTIRATISVLESCANAVTALLDRTLEPS